MTFLPLFRISDALSTSGFGFGLVLTVLAFIMFFVWILTKLLGDKSKKAVKEDAAAEVQSPAPIQTTQAETVIAEESAEKTAPLPYTPGYVTLDGVKEQDAAVIMAITSENTGIPLERLCFKSIRRLNQDPVLENIEEQDAAVIMAIVANKLNKPIENLCFNSIKEA